MSTKRLIRILMVVLILVITVPGRSAHADHGPATSGGGTSTESGQTLEPGAISFGYRQEYTKFEDLSNSTIRRKAAKGGSFDAIDHSFLHTVSLDYGLVEDFQIGLSLGWYNAVNSREGELEVDGGVPIHDFKPDGLTDLWITGKYRLYHGPAGHVAVLTGVKLPTGRNRVKNSAGEFVEPSAAAGSGSVDGKAGLAYSRWLTEKITLNASALYTRRSEYKRFRLGDRVDLGLAVNYRFAKSGGSPSPWSVFLETTVRNLNENVDHGRHDPNTGGTALFLSPGVRVKLSEHASFTLSPQFPVVQNLNGKQQKTDLKVVAAFTFTF